MWYAYNDGDLVEKKRTKKELLLFIKQGHLDDRKKGSERLSDGTYLYVAPRGEMYILSPRKLRF